MIMEVEFKDKFIDFLYVNYPWSKSPSEAFTAFVDDAVSIEKESQLINTKVANKIMDGVVEKIREENQSLKTQIHRLQNKNKELQDKIIELSTQTHGLEYK